MNAITLSQTTRQWLLDRNYQPDNLNFQGDNGDTALMKATRENRDEIVKELIASGVNINIRNNDGNNALWFACFANNFNLIELSLASGVDPNNQNDNGSTALMYAASAGKTEVVRLLLQAGANTELTNLDDFKAIDFSSNIEILKMFKQLRASNVVRSDLLQK